MSGSELSGGEFLAKIKNFFDNGRLRGRRLADIPDIKINPSGGIKIPNEPYVYTSPLEAFSAGALSLEDINFLRTNPSARVLSIGAGPSIFEQWLTDPAVGIGINTNQIHLADKDAVLLPQETFKTYVFDMNAHWPNLSTIYDIIMFVAAFPDMYTNTASEKTALLSNIITKAKEYLAPGGKIRITNLGKLDQVIELLKQDEDFGDVDFESNPTQAGLLIIKMKPHILVP